MRRRSVIFALLYPTRIFSILAAVLSVNLLTGTINFFVSNGTGSGKVNLLVNYTEAVCLARTTIQLTHRIKAIIHKWIRNGN